MKRDDLIHILCRLKYCGDDFATVQTSFSCDMFGKKYEVQFSRENGSFVSFQVKEIGGSHEDN